MEKLITAAQDLTGSWVNLGDAISVSDWNRVALWLNVDINDSADVRFRALPLKTKTQDADQYSYPIKYTSSSKVAIQDEIFELSDDADQKIVVELETKGLVNALQFQVQAGTVGATPGQIDEAEVSLSNY